MRSEKEILELILDTARTDDRIRAVILNGSRANPRPPPDIFQDFDIVYVATEVASFKLDHDWVKRFGELIIMQLPEEMQNPPQDNRGRFVYLMQFADGNRIDLTLFPLANLGRLHQDSLSVLLLDKDGIIDPFPPPAENDYLPKPPSAIDFANCCNEFWWVSPYVAKGLWRQEITYAKYALDQLARDQLTLMLEWYIGTQTQFSKNPGKYGKYFRDCLEPDLWELLLQTYADAGYEHTWQALGAACRRFRIAASRVAGSYGFGYPAREDELVSNHLKHVRTLPRDAPEIY